jgi:transcriptional regulator with XRE-family HTH domain
MKMDKKSLMKEIGNKLRTIREPLEYNHREMGAHLGIDKTSYYRYENGETPPKLMTLYKLGSKFDISLDWLIRGIEPVHCREREAKKEAEPPPPPPPPEPLEILPDDVKEMVEHMERIPVLRYKVLLYFLHLKEKYKETVEAAMKEKKEKKKESSEKPKF